MVRGFLLALAAAICWIFADVDSTDKLYSHVLPIASTLLGLVAFLIFAMSTGKGRNTNTRDVSSGAGIFTSGGDAGSDGGGGGDC